MSLDGINILGKDYLTETEAAHYACLSLSAFREKSKEYGILPIRVLGTRKKAYRKADIQRAIEQSAKCQHFANVAKAGS